MENTNPQPQPQVPPTTQLEPNQSLTGGTTFSPEKPSSAEPETATVVSQVSNEQPNLSASAPAQTQTENLATDVATTRADTTPVVEVKSADQARPAVPPNMPESNTPNPLKNDSNQPSNKVVQNSASNLASQLENDKNSQKNLRTSASQTAISDDHAKAILRQSHAASQPKKSSAIIAVMIALGLLVFGAICMIYFARSSANQPPQWFGNPPGKLSSQSLTGDDNTKALTPAGFTETERPCYKLMLPSSSKVSSKLDCLLMATSSEPKYLNLTITPSSQKNAGLEDLAAQIQKNIAQSGVTNMKTENISLAGSNAKKISMSSADGSKFQERIVVLAPKQSYKQDGAVITSFEISFTYAKATDKQVISTVHDSWKWN